MANSSAGKPLSRSERRHKKATPEPEPTIQIPKVAVIAAVAVMILGAIMGIRTSLQAASGNKPFTLEGKAFEKKGKAGPGGDNVETNPRDTDEEDASNGDWLSDPIMAKSLGIQKCDFDRVHHADMTTRRFSQDYQGVKPVIIEGFVDQKWPAKNRGRWARSSLIDAFGEAAVHVSSGAGIVHSGGESLRTVSMKDFLEDLRDGGGGGDGMSATAFTFDLEFLERNPVLKQDFKVPTIFRSFNSHESMRRGTSWSILSLGASGAGLPFHNHGETWLGVVYGAKRWALYPPSVSRPYAAESKAEWHPLEGSLEWLTEVLPALKSAGEVPPLECMQNAGDLIYVPSNWRHMTLNIGETIGVGGQAAYNSEMRLRDSLELMSTRPGDPELLHSVGLGLAHRGISALDHEGGLGLGGSLDYATGMDTIKAGGSLTPSQTIDLAAKNLHAAKTDRPGYPETHMLLAETLLKGGRLEEAEKVIEEAWKIFSREELPESVPDSTLVTVQLNLARFFLQAQDGPKAEAYLKKGALALMPDHGDGLADLSVALALQGGDDLDKLREAVAMVERAEELGASGEGFESRRNFVIRTAMMAQREGQAAAEELKAEEGTGVDEGIGGGNGITA